MVTRERKWLGEGGEVERGRGEGKGVRQGARRKDETRKFAEVRRARLEGRERGTVRGLGRRKEGRVVGG